jgi:hypothetical protein
MLTNYSGERPPIVKPSRYGEAGAEAGLFAFYLRDHLRAPDPEMPPALGGPHPSQLLDEHPGWTDDDHKAFGHLMSLEDNLALLRPVDEVFDSNQIDLFDNLRRFHAALPFSEGERHWLIAAERIEWPIAATGILEPIATMEDVIISTGVKTPVVGFELVRRWVAWRREAGAFAGQGSLDDARDALDLVGRELLPEAESLPSAEGA